MNLAYRLMNSYTPLILTVVALTWLFQYPANKQYDQTILPTIDQRTGQTWDKATPSTEPPTASTRPKPRPSKTSSKTAPPRTTPTYPTTPTTTTSSNET